MKFLLDHYLIIDSLDFLFFSKSLNKQDGRTNRHTLFMQKQQFFKKEKMIFFVVTMKW